MATGIISPEGKGMNWLHEYHLEAAAYRIHCRESGSVQPGRLEFDRIWYSM